MPPNQLSNLVKSKRKILNTVIEQLNVDSAMVMILRRCAWLVISFSLYILNIRHYAIGGSNPRDVREKYSRKQR